MWGKDILDMKSIFQISEHNFLIYLIANNGDEYVQ